MGTASSSAVRARREGVEMALFSLLLVVLVIAGIVAFRQRPVVVTAPRPPVPQAVQLGGGGTIGMIDGTPVSVVVTEHPGQPPSVLYYVAFGVVRSRLVQASYVLGLPIEPGKDTSFAVARVPTPTGSAWVATAYPAATWESPAAEWANTSAAPMVELASGVWAPANVPPADGLGAVRLAQAGFASATASEVVT
jgi:hypothetical protein